MEKSTTKSRRIASHYVFTPRGLLKNGILSVDPTGRITGIETSSRIDSLAGVEFYNGILIPGLVNAHCHLELSYLKGAIEPGCGFAGFAAGLRAVRNRFSKEERLAAVRFQDARLWEQGVTAVADTCNGDSTFTVKEESRVFYHNFLELYGLSASSVDPLRPLAREAERRELRYNITPHSTYSLGREGFAAAVKGLPHRVTLPRFASPFAQPGATPVIPAYSGPLSIHFMESEGERELFHKTGEMWDWYREQDFQCDFLDYGSPAERILATIPDDRELMLIHNTFVSEKEIAALQGHFGERLTWVLCPLSNRFITDGGPPVELLRKHGAKIALGTDSLASNTTLSPVEEMKAFEGVPLVERLEWATLNGAQALGIDDWCGSLEEGKRPGVVLLEGIDWERMELAPDTKTRRLV